MKFSKSLMYGLLNGVFVLMLLCGCGGQKKVDSMESKVSGYQCSQCKLKYYTDNDVFSASCPACKTGTPLPVVGFVCQKDNRVIIVPQTEGSAVCDQCKQPAIDKKMPTEVDLTTWGGVKKTRQEISQ